MAENQIADVSAGQQLVATEVPAVQDLATGDSQPLLNVLTHLENEDPGTEPVVPTTDQTPGPMVPKPGERQPTGAVTSLP